MIWTKVVVLCLIVAFNLKEIHGHGRVIDPVNRSSAWRKNFDTPKNNNDNEGFCGGREVQHNINGGKCGICGDDYRKQRPRPNENTGKYGTGTIVKTYKANDIIDVEIHITAAHKGYYKFGLCPLNHSKELEEEECFIPLKFEDGSDVYIVGNKPPGIFKSRVKLPKGLTCRHCVFRWEYIAGNTWASCGKEKVQPGGACGPQETFKTCSDIRIE